ncbi:hypothetical protein [Neorhizobium sp. JUb45]|uniref:hypothetical protein n=1 Tax=unclassified Neorhizobium TaxID=2629175 RepID=UPI001047CCAB|nr:hypothetical protein [Neorhizobium sp. JUb45]TCR06219.1 hypothetical protein EDF70_101172 [Neorhizobium sp. JUb45]
MTNLFSSHILSRLTGLLTFARTPRQLKAVPDRELHVVVPEAVKLPLPRSSREEMSVPASINGRDLSTGRL